MCSMFIASDPPTTHTLYVFACLQINAMLETSVTVTVETIHVTAGENDYMMVLVFTGSDPTHSCLPTLMTLPVECTMSPNTMVATLRASQKELKCSW